MIESTQFVAGLASLTDILIVFFLNDQVCTDQCFTTVWLGQNLELPQYMNKIAADRHQDPGAEISITSVSNTTSPSRYQVLCKF